MKKTAWLVLMLTLAVGCREAPDADLPVVPLPANLCTAEALFDDEVRKQLGELTKGKLPGIAVLMARDGKIVYQDGFGLANVKTKEPITPGTRFRIGSVSKQFTAAAILRLEEEGKLALSDPLEKFFPDFPRGREITLYHLLTHTSGIHNYTDKPGFIARVGKPVAPAQIIAWFRDDPADFAPGAKWLYSNSGYVLLGEIVTKVAGKPYGEYLKEMFFDPLGMKDTGIYANDAPPNPMAVGYAVTGGKAKPALDWDMSWATGAGPLYSTVGDLFRWNEGLFGGRVLKEASLKVMITPVKLPEEVDGASYGCGLAIWEMSRLPVIGHDGSLDGWISRLLYFPGQKCTVAVLVNAQPCMQELEPIAFATRLAKKFLADEIKKLPPLEENTEVDRKTWPEFAGRYDYKSGVMTFTVEEGRLYAKLTGQPKREIFPKAQNEFFWKTADACVTFLRNEKGDVVAARHTQNGARFRAPRFEEPKVKLTTMELDAILGEYRYGRSSVLTVTRDGDMVFAQLTGQPKFPIFPLSAMEFEWRVVKAKVTFSRDKNGKVTSAVHEQNGSTLKAPKIK